MPGLRQGMMLRPLLPLRGQGLPLQLLLQAQGLPLAIPGVGPGLRWTPPPPPQARPCPCPHLFPSPNQSYHPAQLPPGAACGSLAPAAARQVALVRRGGRPGRCHPALSPFQATPCHPAPPCPLSLQAARLLHPPGPPASASSHPQLGGWPHFAAHPRAPSAA